MVVAVCGSGLGLCGLTFIFFQHSLYRSCVLVVPEGIRDGRTPLIKIP